MSLLTRLAATGASPPVTYIEDVFSAYTYTGNGSTQSIVNGVDLAGKGGGVWWKARAEVTNHFLNNTIDGGATATKSNSTAATDTFTGNISSYDSTGYTVDNGSGINFSGRSYISWSFAVAPKFFYQAQATVSGGVTATVDLSSLGTVGMVAVKRTDSTSAWFVFHRSCTSGKLVYLNTTDAETTDGSITLSGTTLSLVGGTIANGTYIVYAWAHDTSATGLIQCISFTSPTALQSLGWEPQLVWMKRISAAGAWYMLDTARGMVVAAAGDNYLQAQSSAAESTGNDLVTPAATGFYGDGITNGDTYIAIAIRRGPMKLPTVGTQVYNAELFTGNDTARTFTGAGFPPDLIIPKNRNSTQYWAWTDRLRGATKELYSSETAAETTAAQDILGFDTMLGCRVGTGGAAQLNGGGNTYVLEYLRRYPGVFDEVCYTGTGSATTFSHNLGVVPELMIAKCRDAVVQWGVYHKDIGNTNFLELQTTAQVAAGANVWNSTSPTATAFTVGSDARGNYNTHTMVMYLFATLAGISKVGSYTGNGSSLTLNMGFAAGARFFMCKRTDSTGDWFVWDSIRGIIAGNDPHLSLNTTAAEVTSDDSVDPDNSGIIVNEVAATHINVNLATYIYLALA